MKKAPAEKSTTLEKKAPPEKKTVVEKKARAPAEKKAVVTKKAPAAKVPYMLARSCCSSPDSTTPY